MLPYYDHDGITIYHADCRDVLESILHGIDVVLTDPPYGINGSSGTINKKRNKGGYAAQFDDNEENIISIVVPIMSKLIANVGCVVMTPGNKHFAKYPQPHSFGVFYQPASVGLQTFGNCDAQPIFYYGRNALGRNMGIPCSYQLTEAPPKFDHPCIKPTKAWRTLLGNIAKPGMCILDPFMGTGTTLRVAKDLGMRAIGIELEERYCAMAVERLAQSCMVFA